jgi:phage tail-like protein
MPITEILKHDPLIASNFYLEIDGAEVATLSEVSGLDIEVEVVEAKQTAKGGMYQVVKSLGQAKAPEPLSIKRISPLDIDSDPLWKWFNDIRDKGMSSKARGGMRKNGSIVIFDSDNAEIARWNFFNSWPSKISSDAFSAGGTEAISETITLVIERLERKK